MRKRGPRAPKRQAGRPTRQKGKLLPIVDPARLAEEIGRAIDERFAGNRTEAADASGLTLIWLTRFLDSAVPARSVERRVVEALVRLCAPARRVVLIECFYPKGTDLLLQRYGEWLRDSLTRSSAGSGRWVALSGLDPSAETMRTDAHGFTQRDNERQALWAAVRSRFGHIAQRWENLSARRSTDPDRMELAKRRLLDPLIESAESGFVEASWRHMSDADLRAVLILGMEREELMIGKETPLERISNVLAGKPLFHRQRKPGKARGRKAAPTDWSMLMGSTDPDSAP